VTDDSTSRNFWSRYIVNKMTMQTLLAIALVLTSFSSVVTAQTAGTFTGTWDGTYTREMPDGTSKPTPIVFNITQKGKEITGTAGPAEQQTPIDKGVVDGGKATFQVQSPGPLFKFTLTVVKGRLQGDMIAERDGKVIGTAKVDAAKAVPGKK
jgi:hypothetical protein